MLITSLYVLVPEIIIICMCMYVYTYVLLLFVVVYKNILNVLTMFRFFALAYLFIGMVHIIAALKFEQFGRFILLYG